MSLKISEEDKNLINLSCKWLKSKNKQDKNCGKYLMEQIIEKYVNELMEEDDYTSILTETLENKINYDNSYKHLCSLNLFRKCEEIKELMANE